MIKIEDLASILQYSKENITDIPIFVQPDSTILGITGIDIWRTSFKISLVSSPVGGKANFELQKYVSSIFDIPMKEVSLLSGNKSRKKILRVNLLSRTILSKLEEIMNNHGSK